MKKMFSYVAIFTFGFVVCAFALRASEGQSLGLFNGQQSKQAVLTSLAQAPTPARRFVGDSVVADAAAKLEPAIVNVHTQGKTQEMASNPLGDDPIFRQFFGGRSYPGGPPERSGPTLGAGSGVIISADGYILTNDHVVANTEKVNVSVGDKGYTARVIGSDPVSDVAVVKIDPQGAKLPVAELGNSDEMRVGDWAIAIGNPLDVGTTVTLGIVSAVNRKGLNAEGRDLAPSIQTDAAINPGNSGGALANIAGQVIGINEAIYSPTGSYVGIGFAIPINEAKRIAAQLIKTGKVVRPYLGIQYGPLKGLSAEERKQIGVPLNGDDGLLINQVYPGTPAAQAGLKTYDVILEANRQKLTDRDDLNAIIQKSKPGDTLALLVWRGGSNQTVSVTLRERPASFGQRSPQARPRSRQFVLP